MVYTADLKSAALGIEGSSPSSRTNQVPDTRTQKRGGSRWKPCTLRGSYSGNTLAFQANAESSILLPRSS
jgi:hypothetical protein